MVIVLPAAWRTNYVCDRFHQLWRLINSPVIPHTQFLMILVIGSLFTRTRNESEVLVDVGDVLLDTRLRGYDVP
jgi:hypothetical protein